MRLGDWARSAGVSYETARRWWRTGKLGHLRIQQPAGRGGAIEVDFSPPTIICGGENIIGRPLGSDYVRQREAVDAAIRGIAPYPGPRWA